MSVSKILESEIPKKECSNAILEKSCYSNNIHPTVTDGVVALSTYSIAMNSISSGLIPRSSAA